MIYSPFGLMIYSPFGLMIYNSFGIDDIQGLRLDFGFDVCYIVLKEVILCFSSRFELVRAKRGESFATVGISGKYQLYRKAEF